MLSSGLRWGVKSLGLGLLVAGCGLGDIGTTPVVTLGPRVSPSEVVSGTEVQIMLQVTDKDGDTPLYRWSQMPTEPAGSFSDKHIREPIWTAPEVPEPTSFRLEVNIRDDHGNALQSWTSILVRPRS
jgi:hypothetical protein